MKTWTKCRILLILWWWTWNESGRWNILFPVTLVLKKKQWLHDLINLLIILIILRNAYLRSSSRKKSVKTWLFSSRSSWQERQIKSSFLMERLFFGNARHLEPEIERQSWGEPHTGLVTDCPNKSLPPFILTLYFISFFYLQIIWWECSNKSLPCFFFITVSRQVI